MIGAVFETAKRVSAAFGPELGAEGTFLAMNDRISQSVPHVHAHVVPRRKGDGLKGFFWPRQPYESDEQAASIAARIRIVARPLERRDRGPRRRGSSRLPRLATTASRPPSCPVCPRGSSTR